MTNQERAAVGTLADSVAAEIRAEMSDQQISGAALSRLTGMSQNYIAKRLRGELPFTLNDLESVSKALGLSPSEVLTRGLELVQLRRTRRIRTAVSDKTGPPALG